MTENKKYCSSCFQLMQRIEYIGHADEKLTSHLCLNPSCKGDPFAFSPLFRMQTTARIVRAIAYFGLIIAAVLYLWLS